MISFEIFGYRSIIICYWEIIINLFKCYKNIEIMFFKQILSYEIYGEIWLKWNDRKSWFYFQTLEMNKIRINEASAK